MKKQGTAGFVASIMLLTLLAASTVSAGSLVTVSGPSTFANCAIGGPGTNYLNAEVEPWVDVNPKTIGTNRLNLLGAWQQDRWSNGGSHGLVAGYSFDGGKTWGNTPLPFTACVPGGLPYERASDPWVSFGPDGTAYTISISFNQSNNDNAVGVATSTDGGKTWANLQTLIADTGTFQFFNDKESVTADPIKAGVAYAVWDRLVSPTDNPYAAAHAYAYSGPSLFSKTTDGGRTWTKPVVIVNTAQNNQTIGNQIVVEPRTGTLYNFFDLILSTGSNITQPHGTNVAFIKSTDGGISWTQPQIISSLGSVGVKDPNTGAIIRTGDIIPEPAIDPATGALYVVWQDARFNGGIFDEIAISSSTDEGATWTAPTRVNTNSGRPAFNPSIKVNSAGKVGVSYYDFRNLSASNTTTLPTDVWFTSSANSAASFASEIHVAGSFDLLTAPYAGGYFVGDYQGLTAIGANFQIFFAATTGNTTNRNDIYTMTLPG